MYIYVYFDIHSFQSVLTLLMRNYEMGLCFFHFHLLASSTFFFTSSLPLYFHYPLLFYLLVMLLFLSFALLLCVLKSICFNTTSPPYMCFHYNNFSLGLFFVRFAYSVCTFPYSTHIPCASKSSTTHGDLH